MRQLGPLAAYLSHHLKVGDAHETGGVPEIGIMVCNLRLRLLPELCRGIIQASHEPDAPLHLRCCHGRLLALVLLTRRPSDHSAGEFAFLLQHQAGQRQQGSNGCRRAALTCAVVASRKAVSHARW